MERNAKYVPGHSLYSVGALEPGCDLRKRKSVRLVAD